MRSVGLEDRRRRNLPDSDTTCDGDFSEPTREDSEQNESFVANIGSVCRHGLSVG